jgi:hypothetical protein
MALVDCPNCKKSNRIAKYRLGQRAVCGACKDNLPEPSWLIFARIIVRKWPWLVLIGLFGLAYWGSVTDSDRNKQKLATEEPQCTPVPPPEDRLASYGEGGAPLRLVVPAGSDYFVKLVDTNGREISAFYMFGGSSKEIDVPFGEYRIRYASGQQWCGLSELFGPDTSFSEADETFSFGAFDGKISGYTVELIPQAHGNLATKHLGKADF